MNILKQHKCLNCNCIYACKNDKPREAVKCPGCNQLTGLLVDKERGILSKLDLKIISPGGNHGRISATQVKK